MSLLKREPRGYFVKDKIRAKDYMGIKKYSEKIRKLAGKAVNRYGMISSGDRVAAALSGGKDSYAMLESLAVRRKYIPIHYDILAVHVEVENVPYRVNLDFMKSFCDELNVSLISRKITIDFKEREKSTCFVCSWHRRKELFGIAAEHKCNRLAFGHHMDDIIETLLMNMVFNGSISTMPPKISMFGGEFDIIRPLALVTERELARYGRIRGIPDPVQACQFGASSRRSDMKRIISEMEKLYRKARRNIYHSMMNIREEYLPRESEE